MFSLKVSTKRNKAIFLSFSPLYWIASACDKIYATDTAVIGSICVVSIFEKDDDNKTIEIVSSQSPNKRPNVETEEGKTKIQEHVDALVDVFINKVALNRDRVKKYLLLQLSVIKIEKHQNIQRNPIFRFPEV